MENFIFLGSGCFGFICSTFHLTFKEEREINQVLKSSSFAQLNWNFTNFLCMYFSRILLKFSVTSNNLSKILRTQHLSGYFCKNLLNLYKMKVIVLVCISPLQKYKIILSNNNAVFDIRQPLTL